MTTLYESALTDLEGLDVQASVAEVVTWRGRRALKLNGLALVRGLQASDATIEVQVCAEEAAYPGIAFRVGDALNYELAYAPPHTSGLWDALQYDPVFHGSNTWQLYHGEGYQRTATVPLGKWFHLRVDVQGARAGWRRRRWCGTGWIVKYKTQSVKRESNNIRALPGARSYT